MNPIDSINRLIAIFLDTLRQFGAVRIWFWLLVYFILQTAILVIHESFHAPQFHEIIHLWTSVFGSEIERGFTHYPGHYMLLPYLFYWAKMALGLLIEGFILGGVALMFYERFVQVDKEDRFTVKRLLGCYAHLVMAYFCINGILIGANMLISSSIGDILAGSPRRVMLYEWGVLPVLDFLLVAMFLFVIPSIAVYHENIFRAFLRSFRMFFKHPIFCFILTAILLSGQIIFSNLTSNPAKLVELFRPELIFWILLAGLILDLFIHYFWMGTSVRYLIDEEN